MSKKLPGVNTTLEPLSSQVTKAYWLYAERKIGNYPEPTDGSSKWLIFVSLERIDQVWKRIKIATEEGRLGDSAKVATAKTNPNAVDFSKKVICVYTYDWNDREDVMRIRSELRRLGIGWKIPYKTDEDTVTGKYCVSGHPRISKYYE